MLKHKPAWWQLYLLAPVMFSLMAIEHLKPLPGVSDQIFDTVVMVLTFGALLGWVYWNRANLRMDDRRGRTSVRSYKITVYEPATNTTPDTWDSDDLISGAPARPLTPLQARQLPVRPGSHQRFLN